MKDFKIVIKRSILLMMIILIWNIVSKYVNPLFVPSIRSVLFNFKESLQNGMLLEALKYSFFRILIATFISSIVAIPLGLLIHNFRTISDIFSPIISVMRYIPVTAFYPLLIMWFGIDELMKIVFLFIAMFVYMMPSVILCLEEINQDLIDTGRTIGMSKIQTITKIQLPYCMPSILNSFVMMFGIGWTYIAVVETINAKYGLGYIIQQSSARGRTDLVFMSIITIMIVSIVFDTVAKKIIKEIFKWRYLDDSIS